MPIYTKNALQVIIGASKDETRPNIQAVYFDKDGSTVATNGHVMFRVLPPSKPIPDDDFPNRPGMGEDIPAPGIAIDKRYVERVIKGIPKSSNLDILKNVHLGKGDNGSYKLTSTDLDIDTVVNCEPAENAYPNWRQVWPDEKDKPVFRINLMCSVLESLVKFIKVAGEPEYVPITFTFYGEQKATTFETMNRDTDQKIEGVFMPARKT